MRIVTEAVVAIKLLFEMLKRESSYMTVPAAKDVIDGNPLANIVRLQRPEALAGPAGRVSCLRPSGAS